MSDEQHESEEPQFLVFNTGPSPEQINMMRMAANANAHATQEFLESLNEEQMVKLLGLLHQLEVNPAASPFYQGICIMLMQMKFNKCAVCGKDHDAELTDMSGQADQPLGQAEVDGAREQAENMKKYRLEWWTDPADGHEKLRCKQCFRPYVSLEDRMLRSPGIEGCPGCVQKEKWG